MQEAARNNNIIRMLAWNVKGVRTDEIEPLYLINNLRQDVVILCEPRVDISQTIARI